MAVTNCLSVTTAGPTATGATYGTAPRMGFSRSSTAAPSHLASTRGEVPRVLPVWDMGQASRDFDGLPTLVFVTTDSNAGIARAGQAASFLRGGAPLPILITTTECNCRPPRGRPLGRLANASRSRPPVLAVRPGSAGRARAGATASSGLG